MNHCDCKVKCQFCSAYFHMYSCTCLDACTNSTVCKHIHLLQMNNARPHMDKNDVEKQYNQECNLDYYQNVSSFEFPFTKPSTIAALLNQIKTRLAIASISDNSNNIECLKSVYDDIGHVLTRVIPSSPTRKRKPSKTNSKIQRRFYSTKNNGSFQVNLLKNLQLMKQHIVRRSYMLTDAEICAVCFCKDDKLEDNNIDWIDCNKCSIWVHKNCVTAYL